MKNTNILIALLFAGTILIISCKKKDTTSPAITLSGDSEMQQHLNSAWQEPGYSASDNIDGDITSNVTVSGSVDPNFAGTYVLTYSVSDIQGNETSVKRAVKIYNEAGYIAGKYFAVDTCPLSPSVTYTTNITPSTTVNNEFIIENFGGWNSKCICYTTVKMSVNGAISGAPLSWTNQRIAGTDSLHASASGGTITNLSPVALSFSYQWANGSSTQTCSSQYTHQ
jgi:hypothetical protein